MTNKLQTAAVAFLIFISTLCSAQHASIQGTVYGSKQLENVINVAVDTFGGHSMLLGCTPTDADCKMLLAGDSVLIVFVPNTDRRSYIGTNVVVSDGDQLGVYWVKESR
jgi:hypothetical protein